MQVKTQRDAQRLSALVTLPTCAFVACVIMLVYPPELWAWELSISVGLTSTLTSSITYAFGIIMYRNYLLNCELQRLVNRDRLTDIATRDFFFKHMETDPHVYGVSLMIDIDHFKSVNDTFGHYVGDGVIQHVSAILRQHCRTHDIVCRFGGEEFVVFLHTADGDKGLTIAERIRAGVEATPYLAEAAPVSITVSIGGSLKERLEDINISIKRADDALYRAKRMGRNRTEVDWIDVQPDQRKAS